MSDLATQTNGVLAETALGLGSVTLGEGPLGHGPSGTIPPMVALPTENSVFDSTSGTWVPYRRGNYEAPAVRGEQNTGFAFPRENGWVFVAGPSGTQKGHRYNAGGEDGAVFNVKGPFHLFVLDNKAETRTTVRSATALDENLGATLRGLRDRVADTSFDDMPRAAEVRNALRVASDRHGQGLPLPADVSRNVTNLGGRSTRVSGRLNAKGVRFMNLADETPPVPVAKARPAALSTPPAGASLIAKAAAPVVGLAAGLVADWLKDKLLESLAKMPPPEVKPGSVWSEGGLKGRLPLDLVATHLAQAIPTFEAQRGALTMQMLARWNDLDRAPAERRGPILLAMTELILDDRRQLAVAAANVDDALATESQMVAAVAAARDLLAMVDNSLIYGAAIQYGSFTIDQLEGIKNNLAWYAAALDRGVLVPLRYLKRRLGEAIAGDEAILRQIGEAGR